jgi:transposase
MPILADTIDGVIGVDTHRDTLAAAALSPVGGVLAQTATSADATGYQQLLEFAGTQIPRDRRGAAGRSRAPAATAPG